MSHLDQLEFSEVTGVRAALLDVSDRGLLRVTGRDRARFLNGMLSNDVAKLAVGTALPALLLTRKGHILSELDVLARENELWLDPAPGTASAVRETLDKYIIADDVRIEDWSDRIAQLSIEGPGARELILAAGVEAPARNALRESSDGVSWLGGGALTPEGVRAFVPRDGLAALRARFALPDLTPQQVALLRVSYFVPAYGVDMSEDNFPQEARRDHCISYTKGCYIGQEIVARIHSRGAVRKFLTQLELDAPVALDTELRAAGRPAGSLTRVEPRPGGGAVALGYLGRDLTEPGTVIEAGSVAGRVATPRS